jgi:N6-L-threonylcarbamoyladenine synthase
MLRSKNLDFSFSGLKTAVLYKLKEFSAKEGGSALSDGGKEDMARAFEDSAIEVLVEKTHEAILNSKDDIKTLIVAGGVSANTYLSKEMEKLMEQFPNIHLRLPTKSLATDNAIMIGIASYIKAKTAGGIPKNQIEIKAQGNLSIS